ncbi:hypothetical protein CLU79DRAFT_754811 [Phycomyces nitens]|nr:hypothetical protein CLU79DRAFT_754811 [Phycomyces nitens]
MTTSGLCIIRIEYLSPYKIFILLLIKIFCCEQFSPNVLSNLSSFLLDVTLESEAIEEPLLGEVVEILIESLMDQDRENLIRIINENLEYINTPHNMNTIIKDTERLLEEPMSEATRSVDRESPFGVYIRRCLAANKLSNFLEVTNTFAVFQAYVSGSADDKILQRLGSNDMRTKSILFQQEKDGLDRVSVSALANRIDGWITDDIVVNFLDNQIRRIRDIGKSDCSPKVLDKYLDFLQVYAPDIKKIDHVRALNLAQVKEYESASITFHKAVDTSLLTPENEPDQYSMLNLGILETRFGHIGEAIQSFSAALILAQKRVDQHCLNEVQSWLRYVSNADTYIGGSPPVNIKSDVEERPRVIYHQNLYDLIRIHDALLHGRASNECFERLFQTIIRGGNSSVKGLSTFQNLVASHLWRHYGYGLLADNYLDAALNTKEEMIDNVEKKYIYAAETFIAKGEYKRAQVLLDTFRKQYPDQSAMMIGWKQVQYRLDKHCPQSMDSNEYLFVQEAMIPDYHPQSQSKYYDAKHQHAMEFYKNGDLEKSRILLEQTLVGLKKEKFPSHIAINLMARARLNMDVQYYSEAILLLEEVLIICKEANDAQNYYAAAIQLGEVLLHQNPNDKREALFITEKLMPKVKSLESVELMERCLDVYKQASAIDA